ncbi:ABC transporter permease [Lysinibacter cavernae]|uniref:ABC-2 type transport system permease protein n=1 Tax=Lysinibacter cavernae TaxID=1640652 RepID=A0A7X5TSI8_9MICO|nr:ABC transporter permease [Lysinibacter cavernae]NIH53586.1 ABC-2 type transport system permease protein [Lysinibacter cavernae]
MSTLTAHHQPNPNVPKRPAASALSEGATKTNAFRSYRLMLIWQLRRQSQYLPLLIVVQSALAVATVIGYGMLIGDVAPAAALFLATGAPTITLVSVGFVMTPQMMSQSKTEGSADWMNTLPVPRLVFLAADLTVWTFIALPGVVLAIVAGVWRYDLELSVAWWIVPASLLISLTAASIGYAMAALLPPMVAMLLTQLLIFILLLFSPISFPASNLPAWLQTVHEWLPIQPMADLMRAGLAQDAFSISTGAVITLIVWCAASVAAAGWALSRRR